MSFQSLSGIDIFVSKRLEMMFVLTQRHCCSSTDHLAAAFCLSLWFMYPFAYHLPSRFPLVLPGFLPGFLWSSQASCQFSDITVCVNCVSKHLGMIAILTQQRRCSCKDHLATAVYFIHVSICLSSFSIPSFQASGCVHVISMTSIFVCQKILTYLGMYVPEYGLIWGCIKVSSYMKVIFTLYGQCTGKDYLAAASCLVCTSIHL